MNFIPCPLCDEHVPQFNACVKCFAKFDVASTVKNKQIKFATDNRGDPVPLDANGVLRENYHGPINVPKFTLCSTLMDAIDNDNVDFQANTETRRREEADMADPQGDGEEEADYGGDADDEPDAPPGNQPRTRVQFLDPEGDGTAQSSDAPAPSQGITQSEALYGSRGDSAQRPRTMARNLPMEALTISCFRLKDFTGQGDWMQALRNTISGTINSVYKCVIGHLWGIPITTDADFRCAQFCLHPHGSICMRDQLMPPKSLKWSGVHEQKIHLDAHDWIPLTTEEQILGPDATDVIKRLVDAKVLCLPESAGVIDLGGQYIPNQLAIFVVKCVYEGVQDALRLTSVSDIKHIYDAVWGAWHRTHRWGDSCPYGYSAADREQQIRIPKIQLGQTLTAVVSVIKAMLGWKDHHAKWWDLTAAIAMKIKCGMLSLENPGDLAQNMASLADTEGVKVPHIRSNIPWPTRADYMRFTAVLQDPNCLCWIQTALDELLPVERDEWLARLRQRCRNIPKRLRDGMNRWPQGFRTEVNGEQYVMPVPTIKEPLTKVIWTDLGFHANVRLNSNETVSVRVSELVKHATDHDCCRGVWLGRGNGECDLRTTRQTGPNGRTVHVDPDPFKNNQEKAKYFRATKALGANLMDYVEDERNQEKREKIANRVFDFLYGLILMTNCRYYLNITDLPAYKLFVLAFEQVREEANFAVSNEIYQYAHYMITGMFPDDLRKIVEQLNWVRRNQDRRDNAQEWPFNGMAHRMEHFDRDFTNMMTPDEINDRGPENFTVRRFTDRYRTMQGGEDRAGVRLTDEALAQHAIISRHPQGYASMQFALPNSGLNAINTIEALEETHFLYMDVPEDNQGRFPCTYCS